MAHVLEEKKKLSESILWDLQDNFYSQTGVNAWSNAIVPNFVTSNAFIASSYAKLILSFIHDWHARRKAQRGDDSDSGDEATDDPVYICEIGAGHGKMGFLILTKLVALKEFWPKTKGGPPFIYVLTDFAQANVEFWKGHDCFRRFAEQGLVDFAVFDSQKDSVVRLQLSGAVISRRTCLAPMVAICNYVFDTLKQDAFRIEKGGRLQEALCTVISERHEPNPRDKSVIRRIRCNWHVAIVSPFY